MILAKTMRISTSTMAKYFIVGLLFALPTIPITKIHSYNQLSERWHNKAVGNCMSHNIEKLKCETLLISK